MKNKRYYLPNNYQKGRIYFYKNGNKENACEYIPVRMCAYRPHPAELVIEVNGEKKLIQRRFLYSLEEVKTEEMEGNKSGAGDQ